MQDKCWPFSLHKLFCVLIDICLDLVSWFAFMMYSHFILLLIYNDYLAQMIHMKYGTPDGELQNYAIQAMDSLQGNDSPDPHALVSSSDALRFISPQTGTILFGSN